MASQGKHKVPQGWRESSAVLDIMHFPIREHALNSKSKGGPGPPWLYFRTQAPADAALGRGEDICGQFGAESSQIKCNMYRTSELSHAPIWVREVA